MDRGQLVVPEVLTEEYLMPRGAIFYVLRQPTGDALKDSELGLKPGVQG